MSDLYWLTNEQMSRLQPYFPKSHGKPRVHDRRVLSGIVFVNRNGLRWRDAPKEYGPHKTLYNRWKRWGEMREPAQSSRQARPARQSATDATDHRLSAPAR
ncbi:IS5 family transposase [Pseudomonas fluorescens BRIP34879]|nr:IS5 family transposase [Pseudomonas fluorescens BRIP34879]